MKSKLLLAGTLLGFALWVPPASARFSPCATVYCGNTVPTAQCTCPGTTLTVTCGGWKMGACSN
jgi:hypothetical protein